MNNEDNKENQKNKKEKKLPRQIIIETDGNIARIIKAEVAGSLELKAILKGLADSLN